MKQKPQSNIIYYGLPLNMYTKTEGFDQRLFFSKSEAAIHYGSYYHRQRSFHSIKNLHQLLKMHRSSQQHVHVMYTHLNPTFI